MIFGVNSVQFKNGKVYNLDNNYFGMSANFNYQKGLENLEGIFIWN